MDLSLFSHDVAAQAPQVAAVCKPIIKTVTKIVPHLVGVKFTTAILSTAIAFVVGGGLSWWFFKPKKVATIVDAPTPAEMKKNVTEA